MITLHAQRGGGALRSTAQLALDVRVANAIYAYATYLWKMMWPARLAPLYPYPGESLAASQVVAATLVLVAVTALVFRLRPRRYLLVGWLWFVGTLVPVIGLVQVGDAGMADRYAYIPLIGVFVMISFGIAEWAKEKELRIAPMIVEATVVIALAAATHGRLAIGRTT